MTIKDCIDIVDNLKPNQYTIKDKVGWLSFIEEIIINEVLKTHEGYDGRYDMFEGYSEDKLSTPLIVASPYDRLYTEYLKMKIDEANGEIARYNNSRAMYESHMTEFRKYYNKTHMPISTTARRTVMPPNKGTSGMSDAQYENLKRDISNIMQEQIVDATSPDKIADVVTKYVQNNIEMLKGKDGKDGVDGKDGYTPRKNIDYFDGENGKAFTYKDFTPEQLADLKGEKGDKGVKGDQGERGLQGANGLNGTNGYTPIKGIDYWTPEDKAQIKDYVDVQTAIIKSDIEGIQEDIKNEAHFRGYLSTNAKIQAMEATPNDYAYSAESGTKWVYDAENGWQDTGTPVPDQLTPASETTPLINGEASVGTEQAYARGDHRHPTDTTRASVEDLHKLRSDVETDIADCVKDADCELIEEITITEEGIFDIIRNTEPDGTPYNFKAVTVYQEIKPCEVQNLVIMKVFPHIETSARASGSLASFQVNNTVATAGRFITAHFDVVGGCWQALGVGTTIQGSPTPVQAWRYTTPYQGETIKSVSIYGYTTNLEVGTVIQIYGVRA